MKTTIPIVRGESPVQPVLQSVSGALQTYNVEVGAGFFLLGVLLVFVYPKLKEFLATSPTKALSSKLDSQLFGNATREIVHILALPSSVLLLIVEQVDALCLTRLSRTHRVFYAVTKHYEEMLWRRLCIERWHCQRTDKLPWKLHYR